MKTVSDHSDHAEGRL